MAYFKLSLSELEMNLLDQWAAEAKMTRQEYVRYKLFGKKTSDKFTPEEAVRLAREKHARGELPSPFSIPMIYGDDWTLERAVAGVFGRRFFKYIIEGKAPDIRPAESVNLKRQAQYEFVEGCENE